MAKLLGWIAGLSVFVGWIMLVGNPHVVETVIGLLLALIAGFWVFFKLRKPIGARTNDN
jgi:hypothetical protein